MGDHAAHRVDLDRGVAVDSHAPSRWRLKRDFPAGTYRFGDDQVSLEINVDADGYFTAPANPSFPLYGIATLVG
jgi:hypothetical protein